MKSRRKAGSASGRKSKSRSTPARGKAGPAISRRRLWCYRLLAAVGIPALLLVLIETGLRLAGYGYPTAFLLPSSHDGRKTFVDNNHFGWRFFGPQMSRTPYPCSIPQTKDPGTVRIFVLGGSAAFGDPRPRFGLPHMLQAMLSLRHPGVHFEVVNAAMTAINSNVVLPIARDCARAQGDIWVIYMGNNEVVGPFGAGTVFGSQTPPLTLIRATIALKTTCIGQLLDSFREWFQKPPLDKSQWGGMEMFLNQQVRENDPRMKAVYDHFARNLADILQIGRRSGAGIVLSTVAVNLRDCAPFASSFRPGLSDADKEKWKAVYEQGVKAQASGKVRQAAEQFAAAGRIDDSVAELRFREGQCALALRDIPAAQKQFQAACDLDTLRFRCDSRLNALIRRAASDGGKGRVLLADAQRSFAEHSADGLPGEDLFYEHVHLTFAGNYLLARTLVTQIEKLLPASVAARVPAGRPWPTLAECARRLAWSDWSEVAVLSEVLTRLNDPPFIWQLNHAAQERHLKERLAKLAPAGGPAGMDQALKLCEAAVAEAPDDPELYAQLATLQEMTGDLNRAASSARRELDLLPTRVQGWSQLGYIRVKQGHYADAAAAFEQAIRLNPQDVWSLQNYAQAQEKLGRHAEAMRTFRHALALNPRFGMAWLGLGQLLEAEGHKAEAEDCYRKALANRVDRAPELATLARFCQSRGWYEAAATNFTDAIRMDPVNVKLRIEAGQSLVAAGHHEKAMQEYAEAVRLAPNLEQARFLYGLELGRAGKPAAAAQQFREAVRLMPDLVQARLNLGLALVNSGSDAEALKQFEEALHRDPTNAMALRYAQALREKLAGQPAH